MARALKSRNNNDVMRKDRLHVLTQKAETRATRRTPRVRKMRKDGGK